MSKIQNFTTYANRFIFTFTKPNKVKFYDTDTDNWGNAPNLPHRFEEGNACCVKEMIYFVSNDFDNGGWKLNFERINADKVATGEIHHG